MDHRPWHDCYDEGIPSSLTYPAVPLFHFLEDSAKKYPDKPCTIFKGAEISYKEMSKITDGLAAALVDLGVKKGDRVGILIPNTPQFVMAYFAVLKAGGIVVATNPQYTEREIKHQANDSGMKLMILMSNFYELVKRVQPDSAISQIIVTNIKETLPPLLGLLFGLLKEKKGGFKVTLRDNDLWLPDLLTKYSDHDRPQIDVGPDDTAISWLTSANMGEEVVMMAIPLYHVYGMVCGMNYGLASGATLVMVPDPRDLKDLLGNMQKYQTTIFPGVPALYNLINNSAEVKAGKYDLSAIKACISGSAPLLRETKETFEKLTGGVLFEGYGLSETPTATHGNPNFGENRTGSIGLPFPDVDAKIIDLDDEVTELAAGEIGELIIKAPQVFKGYYNMPTETRNSLREGWLYTGDIARMDEQGYFYIVDRKKEMIKVGGFQVWPREVEEVLQDHPAIQDVGVAGVPDPKRGEIVKTWIVLAEGQSLDREELKTWAKERMAKYKVPSEIEFRDELPKTHIGKLLRRELVREHKEGPRG